MTEALVTNTTMMNVIVSLKEAQENIQRGNGNLGALHTDRALENTLRELLFQYKSRFDENSDKIITDYCSVRQKSTNNLTLGDLIALFFDHNLLAQVEEIAGISLKETRRNYKEKFIKNKGVKVRNVVAHNLNNIDQATADGLFDFLYIFLTELGYDLNRSSFQLRFNLLRENFARLSKQYAPARAGAIIENILTGFGTFNPVNGQNERFDFTEKTGAPKSSIFLFGEGGIGKSTFLRWLEATAFQQEPFQNGVEDFMPIPVYLPLSNYYSLFTVKDSLFGMPTAQYGYHDLSHVLSEVKVWRG